MTDRVALTVADVSVELGGRPVLRNIELAVVMGELHGLIGPNGAGKTTLLRSILGLTRPSSGSVHLGGQQATPGSNAVGYVPQRHEFAWDFPISVAGTVMTGLTKQLGMFRRPGAAHWQAVADALDRVEMTALADRPIGQLSGGQRQRVLVARALATRPSLLLLDEPFTGLDMPTQELLSTLFAGLARDGHAVIMTTHDLVGALDLCDRITLLNRSVRATGTPSELASKPDVWAHTFEIGLDSPLLRILRVAA